MIKIIEYKDYKKPADNDTVVEIELSNGRREKYFKVFDGVWIVPEPILSLDTTNSTELKPYQEKYCQTTEQKSKYLEQMTILFKRINSTTIGQNLLIELSKGSPINFRNIETWDKYNMIGNRVQDDAINRSHKATCIIRPNSGYLNFSAIVQNSIVNHIGTKKAHINFHPDCIMSLKRDGFIHYIDPSVALYHELVHVLHNTYGVKVANPDIEEYATFGHNDSRKLMLSSKYYTEMTNLLSTNLPLLKQMVDIIPNDQDKEYFRQKYGFTKDTKITTKFVNDYLDKYVFTYTEYKFAQELDIVKNNRNTYIESFFVPFKIDISDPNIYTVKRGFLNPSSTLEEIKAQPQHLLVYIKTIEDRIRLNMCFKGESGRVKRDVDDEFIPFLEPLEQNSSPVPVPYNFDNNTINRTKRSASKCENILVHIIDRLDTLYNKVNAIPKNLLDNYAKGVLINIPKNKMFDSSLYKDIDKLQTSKQLEVPQKLETFKVGPLTRFDTITSKDILNAHRVNRSSLDGQKAILFTSKNISHAKRLGSMTFTNNKALSDNMQKLNKTGKAILKTGDRVSSIIQLGIWANQIVEDFKEDSNTDNLHKASNILAIVPYIGDTVNLGVAMHDKDYGAAFKISVTLAVCTIFPEVMLPLFFLDIAEAGISKALQTLQVNPKLNTIVWNMLIEKDDFIDNILHIKNQEIAEKIIKKIERVANLVKQELTFNALAILNNLKYYAYKTFNTPLDKQSVDQIIYETSTKLFQSIQSKHKKIIETLFEHLKEIVLDKFKLETKGRLKHFNEETKNVIIGMLQQHKKDIPYGALKSALDVVEKFTDDARIQQTIKYELDVLAKKLEKGVGIILREKLNIHFPYTHITLNKENKAFNKITGKKLAKQNIGNLWGRKGMAMHFEKGRLLSIDDSLFKKLTFSNNFTIEFWIKVPLTKNYDKSTSKDISIIKNGLNHKNGWGFILNGRYLNFSIYNKRNDKLILGSHIITTNMWTKITLVHNCEEKLLSYFINGLIFNQFPTSWVYEADIPLELNSHVIVGIRENADGVEFSLDDFKIYNDALLPDEVSILYKKDICTELLYDYYGNCLREDKEYVLAVYNPANKIYHPVHQLNENGYWVYDHNKKENTLINYGLTLKLVIEKRYSHKNSNRQDNLIYKNDNIFITSNGQDKIDNKPNNLVKWSINPGELLNKRVILVNNIEKPLISRHMLYINNTNLFNKVKIFNMLDYIAEVNLFNKNVVSFVIYAYDVINSLLLANNKEVLSVDGILENRSPSDVEVKLPIFKNYKLDISKPNYTQQAIFYLFPVDEIEYYTALY